MISASFKSISVIFAALVGTSIAHAAEASKAPSSAASAAPAAASQDSRTSDKAGLDRTETLISPMPSSVNPMTGKSLRSEELEHALREKVIEARIAEQELSITKSRTETRKLGSEKVVADSAPLRVPDAVRNYGNPPAPATAKAKPAKKTTSNKVAADAPSAAPFRSIETPRFVGVMESDGAKVAMVSYQGRVIAVKEGTTVEGIRVSSIAPDTALINSRPTRLEQAAGSINLPETRQAVQPGSALAMATQQPTKGVVVQGINTPAVQPVAPGTPLGGGSTQPVQFPPNFYNR